MLFAELALENRPDCLLRELIKIVFEEGTNFAAGLNDFDPDIGDCDGVHIEHHSSAAFVASVEQIGPIVGVLWEVYSGEWNLHAGLANFASQHGIGAEGEENSVGFGEHTVEVQEVIS